MKKSILVGLLFSSLALTSAHAREQIKTVGSSTVFPFSTVVAENFGKTSQFKTPVIESTGTGGGIYNENIIDVNSNQGNCTDPPCLIIKGNNLEGHDIDELGKTYGTSKRR